VMYEQSGSGCGGGITDWSFGVGSAATVMVGSSLLVGAGGWTGDESCW
jgi:hypothetical protein